MSVLKTIKTKFFVALTLLSLALVAGCGSDNTSVSNPAPNIFNPKGTVSGVLRDAVTQVPIQDAVVHIMNRTASTDSAGIFVITDVPALNGAGNEPSDGNAAYPVVIDMTQVNNNIKSFNDNPNNTVKKPFYPSTAYTAASPVYTSLGETSQASGNTNATNHDTPVDGFVANITPFVGKLDANIKIQVVDTKLKPVADATVNLYDALGSNNDTSGLPGHLIQTRTSDASGFVTFTAVEAKQSFIIKAFSKDGALQGWYGSYAIAGGAATPTGQGAATVIVAPADGLTDVYSVQGGQATDGAGASFTNAIVIGTVDGVAPFILSVSPSNLADIAVPTSGTLDVVFTFSEPIKQSNYAKALTQETSINGGLFNDVAVNFLGPKASNLPYTLAWNADFTQLTVSIPAASVTAASRYSVDISAALGSTSKLVDNAGNAVPAGTANKATAFTTAGPINVVAPVIALSSTVSTAIEWAAVPGASFYLVYVQKDNFTSFPATGTAPNVPPANTIAAPFKVTGFPTFNVASVGGFDLSGGASYSVKVAAVNGNNTQGPFSNIITIKDTAPATPTNLTRRAAAANVTSFNLDWTGSVGAAGYNVYVEQVKGGVGSGYVNVATVNVPTANVAAFCPTFAIGQLKVTYNVKVTAVSQFGAESAATAPVVIDQQTKPTAVKAVIGGGLATPIVNGTPQSVTYQVVFDQNMVFSEAVTATNWSITFPTASAQPSAVIAVVGVNDFTYDVSIAVANPNVADITWAPPATLSCTAKSVSGGLAVAGTF